ncbi:MAG TPA: hypothetical protein DDW34_07810 [Clostridium sp.]|uniref:Uncharacterized protein n=1 Tax=Anaerotignum propionicum DSM 1682 TaxID=991789 RepID=A0A0X8VA82_ANAPI|nr:hypothetical protein [Anaerotignum propionicum]AMJ40295.1 hypothetical protein CPRO_06930 [Anaerotignum propionicum DSM 1682]MEA5057537.1 hypothetical protein [Anaerotignum propionicum]SHE45603.1 hypothetical protein SAMN02745151_00784 [[Clostridium] propionicum DSM 1682] [Anaerotignum propionicum DSM 1682]HBF65651.1 hypothetical protein [Clostridium sp.]
MKLGIEELIENVKDELLCYEDMEQATQKWEKEFRLWIDKNKGKNKDILVEQNQVFFKIKDEEEIFEIANSYMDAIDEGSIKQYWEKF